MGIGAALTVLMAYMHQTSKAKELNRTLLQNAGPSGGGRVDLSALVELPPPVQRYFRHVLTDGQALIRTATLLQAGILRTSIRAEEWSSFTARHLAVPQAAGFVWNAKVQTPFATHVRVFDSYIAGAGSGYANFLSIVPFVSEAETPELNAGALHRYLAEAVWYPTALLPQSGVIWNPVDDESAVATLTNSNTTVSLEFRFNDLGEATGIFTPARFGSFDGQYRQVPWEGHFQNYQSRAGMRIPLYAEVGWYIDETPSLVWKGNITDTGYEFAP